MLWKAGIAPNGQASVTIVLRDLVRHLRLRWGYHPERRYMRGTDRMAAGPGRGAGQGLPTGRRLDS